MHQPSATWPRVYRPSTRQRLWYGTIFAAGGVMGIGLPIAAILTGPASVPLEAAMVAFCVFFTGLSAWGLVTLWHDHVVLHADAIAFVRLGRATVRVRRDEILGFRLLPGPTLVFERHEGKPVRISMLFGADATLEAWFASLRHLEREEYERAEAVLLALGPTQVDSMRAMQSARRIARVIDVATFAAGAWGIFHPYPRALVLAVLAVLPIVAMGVLATGGGRYSLDDGRNDPRARLVIPMLMPSVVLGLRALIDFTTMDVGALIGWATACWVGPTVLVVLLDPALRARWWKPLPFALLFIGYAVAVPAHANMMLSSGPATTTQVEVLDKHVSRGQGGGPELRLAAWGERDEESVRVNRALYDATEVGERVCIDLYDGALGARWFVVRACELTPP
ncbi:hypothetical protein [Sandaracinus amylolyticus]|uniref:hypothetical protein n=1 Tax=Sandaracinus amylolyticus TaxID=927083 RepID=UPI001F1A8704|nr:hypothetical protein [Sandaracinus amylolyticus]UJR85665.1 Hypothetical protein I5071_77450 [Sandaracinus amylolyticus]